MRYVVIMAGGSGTRLWPLSRQGTPKQLLELFDGKSLLRLAYERVAGLVPDARILVCTSRTYADVVARQLPELPEENLLGEPVGRDSLSAVAWSAAVLERRDPETVVAMLSADHIITPAEEFRATLELAFEVAEFREQALVTMGVLPTEPHTGFGYLHRDSPVDGLRGVWRVSEFKEKPELSVARRYVASGEYWWNAGMFVWRAATLLAQLETLVPDTAEKVRRIAAHNELLDELFPSLQKTSVDYAIMQPVSLGQGSAEVLTVGLETSWIDVGSYQNLAEQFLLDEHGNRVDGRSITLDSSGCVIINTTSDGHVVATLGLHDCLVVHTLTATLVAPLAETGRIRELVALVHDHLGAEYA